MKQREKKRGKESIVGYTMKYKRKTKKRRQNERLIGRF